MCLTVFTYKNGFYPYRNENVEKIIDLGKHVRGCEFAVFIRQSDENTYKNIDALRFRSNRYHRAQQRIRRRRTYPRCRDFLSGRLDSCDMFIALGERLVNERRVVVDKPAGQTSHDVCFR
jgi:hypothetical protein